MKSHRQPPILGRCGHDNGKNPAIEAAITALSYEANDLIGSRGLVSEWAPVDGATVNGCDVPFYVAVTNDDPAGTPTWGAWAPFHVAVFTAKLGIQTGFLSGSVTINIDVSILQHTLKRLCRQADLKIGMKNPLKAG